MPRSSPARSCASKNVCIAANVPAVAVWSFSMSSSTGCPCSSAFRRASDACEPAPKPPMAIFRRGAPTARAACWPRCSAASSSTPSIAHRPSGLEYTAARPASAASSVAGSRSISPRTSTPSAPARWARPVHHNCPWRPTSAAPKDESETSARTASTFLPPAVRSMPSTSMRPFCTVSRRLMQRINVDLPDPDGPQITMRSPVRTDRWMSVNT